eukprot:2888910-Pleurochrysis_carterae.AAC.6
MRALTCGHAGAPGHPIPIGISFNAPMTRHLGGEHAAATITPTQGLQHHAASVSVRALALSHAEVRGLDRACRRASRRELAMHERRLLACCRSLPPSISSSSITVKGTSSCEKSFFVLHRRRDEVFSPSHPLALSSSQPRASTPSRSVTLAASLPFSSSPARSLYH